MKVDCNRILVDGRRLCIVKDSCLGCKINSKYCAINDLLEDAGVLESWKNWDMPNFRDRKEKKNEKIHRNRNEY